MKTSLHQYSGFALIEALITTVIMTVGLTGLALLQATSLRNSHSAMMRTHAIQLSAEYADLVRSNATAESANIFAPQTFNLSSASPTRTANCYTSTGCTPTEMANNDIANWFDTLKQQLPLEPPDGSAFSQGARITQAGGIYTIEIKWTDDRTDTDDDGDLSKIFITSFQP